MFKKLVITALLVAPFSLIQAQETSAEKATEMKVLFDIKMRDTVDEVERRLNLKKTSYSKSIYSLEGVKGAPELFKTMELEHTEQGGICGVILAGAPYPYEVYKKEDITQQTPAQRLNQIFNRDWLEENLEREYDYVKEWLEKKYGRPSAETEKNKAKEIGYDWWAAWDFMLPLSDEEKKKLKEDGVDAPKNSMWVTAKRSDYTKTRYVELSFSFSNRIECINEAKARKMQGL